MTVKIIDAKQGSPEWKEHRKTTRNASDYPVAQGLSKNRTRSKLIREAATGIEPEFSDWQEKILANGHRVEELARPMAEIIIGEDLYPMVATSDDGYLGSSSDGATMLLDKGWECKQWNAELAESVANGVVPDTHVGQLDQQGEVFGFESILFMVTDGTPDKCVYCWYVPSVEAKAAIRPVWQQFDADVAAYQPEVIEAKPILTAQPIARLPALIIEVTGRVTHSNLVEFKQCAVAVIGSIKTELVTDQDFVDAIQTVKDLKDIEANAKQAKQNALDQTASIAELHRALDEVAKMAGDVRKALDKKITDEKDSRKAEIVRDAQQALQKHLYALTERVGVPVSIGASPFAEAIKGLKSLDSMRDKVSSALANAKIEANAIADRIDANRKTVEDMSLFPDFASVCTKAPDDFAAMLAMRINARKEAEEKRLAAEREKIRAEEQAKAQREAEAKLEAERAEQRRIAEAEQAERNRIAAEEIRRLDAERRAAEQLAADNQAKNEAPTLLDVLHAASPESIANAMADRSPDAGNTIKLGEICARLGYTVGADFLASLGFIATTDRSAKLYRESDFPSICRCIADHTLALAFKKAA